MIGKIAKEEPWVEYKRNMGSFHNLNSYLDDDMFGKLNKIYVMLIQNNIIVYKIALLNYKSRQYKINRFLSKNDEVFKFKYAEIVIKTKTFNCYIEFTKSKKEISSEIIIKDIEGNIIKKEILDDYRKQIKLLKNKIDKNSIDVKYIRKKLYELVEESDNKITDKMSEYAISWISKKYNFRFYDMNLSITEKNYLKVKLIIKHNSKLLHIRLAFYKWTPADWCSDEYQIETMDGRTQYFHKYEDAYASLMSK